LIQRRALAFRFPSSVHDCIVDLNRRGHGIYPALQSSRADLVDGLKEGGRGTSGSVRQHRFRKIWSGAQVALSVTLLAGAALLITSFVRLSRQNMGFRAENLWIGLVTLPQAQYPDTARRQHFVEQTLAALHAIQLSSATISATSLLAGAGSQTLYSRADGEFAGGQANAGASHDIAPELLRHGAFQFWLDAISISTMWPIIRMWVLISQGCAKKSFWQRESIGKTLLVTSASTPVEIIGVVGDVRSRNSRTERYGILPSLGSGEFSFAVVAVRSGLRVDAVTKLVQSALNSVDLDLAIAIPNRWTKLLRKRLVRRG